MCLVGEGRVPLFLRCESPAERRKATGVNSGSVHRDLQGAARAHFLSTLGRLDDKNVLPDAAAHWKRNAMRQLRGHPADCFCLVPAAPRAETSVGRSVQLGR